MSHYVLLTPLFHPQSIDYFSDRLLDDQFFATFVKTPVSVTFRYSYDRLLRWLLKLSYNNARASNGSVREHQPLCRYILGLDDSPAYPIDLFLGIIAPVETTAAEQSRGLEKIAFPPALRFGWTKLPSTASAALEVQSVMSVGSYLFVILVWKPQAEEMIRVATIRAVTERVRFELLKHDSNSVVIRSACTDVRRFFSIGRIGVI
jgi:hypothetical protein